MGDRCLYYGADRVPRKRLETSPTYRQLSRGTFLCIVEVGMRPYQIKKYSISTRNNLPYTENGIKYSKNIEAGL